MHGALPPGRTDIKGVEPRWPRDSVTKLVVKASVDGARSAWTRRNAVPLHQGWWVSILK